MLKIGITGGIGSGKSIVCEIFKHIGIPVFDADTEAKKLLETPEIIKFYKNEFGNIVFTNNSLDKHKIANLIFNDSQALIKINNFIHPKVISLFSDWCNRQKNCKYVIIEAALIFESKTYEMLDYTALVLAPEKLRMERIIARNNITKKNALQRMKNQMPDEEKKKLASFIIYNDEQSLLLPQIFSLHQIFDNKTKEA